MDGKFSLNDRLILPRLAVHSQNFIFDLQRFTLVEVLEAGAEIPADAKFTYTKWKETPAAEEGQEATQTLVTYYSTSADDFTTENLGNATAITLLQSFNAPAGTALDKSKTPTPGLTLSKSCVFDLNGCTLTFDENTAIGIQVANGNAPTEASGDTPATEAVYNTLTLKDSKSGGKILCQWSPLNNNTPGSKDSTTDPVKQASGNKCYGAINVGTVYDGSSSSYTDSYAKFVVEGGTIESNTTAICGSQASEITINDGTVKSNNACGVYFGHKGNNGSKLTLNGGTITSGAQSYMPAIQVSGNINNKDNPTEININGGKVEYTNNSTDIFDTKTGNAKGDPVAIYASGNTKFNLTGGTIESTGTGVELKNGEIEVTGGTVTSTATNYNASPTNATGNGVTTFGVAIAVSAPNSSNADTGSPTTVKISGDSTKLSGANALAIANPTTSTKKVTATIDGGTLTSSSSTTSSNDRIGNAVLADNSNVVLTVNNGNLGGNVTVSKNTGGTQNNATIIVAGGTTTGEVKVVAVTGSGGSKTTSKVDFNDTTDAGKEAQANAKTALKVVGGKVSNSSSSKNFVAEGYEVKDDGSVGEDPTYTRTWKKQSESDDTKFVFGLAGSGASFSSIVGATLNAAGDSSAFKYDSTNFLFALPGLNNFSSVSLISDDARTYKFAGYSLADDSKTVTITPLNSGVKIASTAGGLINSTITKLEIADSDTLGAYVDATNNNLSYMKGGKGQNTLIAGARNTTLETGDNADTLVGGDNTDTFIYTGGKGVIENYEYGTDIASISGSDAPPVNFDKAYYDGNKFVFDFGDSKTLQFKGSSQVQLLHKNTANGTDTYTYNEKSSIAKEGDGITLGAGFTGKSYDGSDKGYGMIDARLVTVSGGLKISAKDDNEGGTVIGAQGGGTLLGGTGSDLLQSSVTAADSKLTLDGGAYGDDSLVGNQNAYNLFIYRGGADSISGLDAAKDIVRLMGNDYAPGKASVLTDANNNLILNFEGNDAISINGGAAAGFEAISVQSGTRKGYYLFSKNQISYDKGVTLTSYYDNKNSKAYSTFDGAADDNTNYATINAAAVTVASGNAAISIVGNANNNYIVGGLSGGNSLDGGAGNDTLVGGTTGSDLFYYTTGKDVIANFNAASDSISSDKTGDILTAKASNNKLTFTINKKSDELTFNFGDGDAIEKVSLQDGGYLTKDGKVKDKSLTLFSSAKKTIDIATDTLYSGVSTVDAEAVTKQGVTLVGGKGGLYKFKDNNKQKDGFTYGGGSASISGYEGGRDRIDLGSFTRTGFSITDGTDDVVLNLKSGDTTGSISIDGAVGKEVLLRENNKNSKVVFKAAGVLENKAKNPTMATVSAGATGTPTFSSKVKKIFAVGGVSNINLQAGNNNTIIDASKAGGVSLSGGSKNDKLIGATGQADTYFYGAGKDVIQSFGSDDQISLSGTGSLEESLTSAKITKSSSNIKFKFNNNNKNTLTVKAEKGTTFTNGQLQINGETYTYLKNAVQDGGTVSLTSNFGGTFKTSDATQQTIDGHLVKNNLTFVGSTRDEKFIGSDANKKTTFKGGGGADTLVGGASKDTFFYAKSYTGDAEIQSFDFDNDKLKVASGKIGNISTISGGGGIQIGMTNGQKNSSAIVGSFKITSQKTASGTSKFSATNVAFKANNTYYWFAEDDDKYVSADDGTAITKGTLITTENRLSALPTGLEAGLEASVIDLNYSTNLAKSGVAVKVTEKTSN